jgi:hypothetical protein
MQRKRTLYANTVAKAGGAWTALYERIKMTPPD